MTERDWLQCDDWRAMLTHLGVSIERRSGTLYLCAGLRRIWNLLYDQGSRDAVAFAEQAVDGSSAVAEERKFLRLAEEATYGREFDFRRHAIGNQPGHVSKYWNAVKRLEELGVLTKGEHPWWTSIIDNDRTRRLINVANIACCALDGTISNQLKSRLSDEPDWPGGWLVRDIFGNPFQPVAFQPRWRTADVIGVARSIYDDRAFDRMPMLSDALLDADCDDEAIIAHCRSSDPHVRGCWVVDHALGLR